MGNPNAVKAISYSVVILIPEFLSVVRDLNQIEDGFKCLVLSAKGQLRLKFEKQSSFGFQLNCRVQFTTRQTRSAG